jgi:hypothetical protein
MHQTATLAQWYQEKGRHPIYAGGKAVPLPSYSPARGPEMPVELPVAARSANPARPAGLSLPAFSGAAGK